MPEPITDKDTDVVVLSKFFKLPGETSADFLRGIKPEGNEMSSEERRELANEVRASQGIALLES